MAAILGDPDDTLARLAYADWLEETGTDDGRGTLIRLQVALCGKDPDDPALRPLVRLERQARKRMNPALKGEVQIGRDPVYCNGFIEGLTLTPRELLEHARTLFARIPLRRVRLIARQPQDLGHIPALLESGHLARLSSVEIAFPLRPADLGRITACPHLSGLRSLSFRDFDVGARGVRLLADSPHLTGLRRLELHDAPIGDAGAAVLAGSANFSGLEALLLPWGRLTTVGVRHLADSPHLARLRELDLSSNEVSAAGVEAITTSASLAGLERLSLAFSLGAEAARAFRHATRPGRLSRLVLSGPHDAAGMGDAGAAALVESPWLGGLRSLHLSEHGIGPAGTLALATSHHLSRLHTLGLGDNPVGDDGARWIARSHHLAGLGSLRLSDCRIGSAGAKALAESRHIGSVLRLDL
jgi:uncharacterized protein (TIGR02996 family)